MAVVVTVAAVALDCMTHSLTPRNSTMPIMPRNGMTPHTMPHSRAMICLTQYTASRNSGNDSLFLTMILMGVGGVASVGSVGLAVLAVSAKHARHMCEAQSLTHQPPSLISAFWNGVSLGGAAAAADTSASPAFSDGVFFFFF